MKAPFSSYLNEIAPAVHELTDLLSSDFDYVSVLASDSKGFSIRISQHSRSVSDQTMTTERGMTVRFCRDGLYSEYALNDFSTDSVKETAAKIIAARNAQISVLNECGSDIYRTDVLDDEPMKLFAEMETGTMPEEADLKALVEKLTALSDEGMKMSEYLIDCALSADSTHISKLFVTKNRDLRQSYVYSEGTIVAISAKGEVSRIMYDGIADQCGPELFEKLDEKLPSAVKEAEALLDADSIEPGEYEIIATPEISGLIAHEAFGHGVEMDMFVKNRALGKDYIGKRVGSDLVSMHEGALCAKNVTSYAFDDEGVLAQDVTEIDHGILKTGICDALSAKRLGVQPTGNGKRENFEHKVYTRMTNTIFDSGTDTFEDMLASVRYGFLLEGTESGMEDPKHWGIQCAVRSGREIKDGKLTGRIVSPVIMTGYVPDLLGNVTMVSKDRVVFGNGGCGKGYKEFVKVADGGPYLKTKARLG